MSGVRDDEFRVGGALRGVMKAAVVIDSKRLGVDTVLNRRSFGVFSVDSGGEGGDLASEAR